MTDSSVGIFNKSALPAVQRNRLLGFFYPSARVSLFTFLTFYLQQISSIPSFTLKTYSPKLLLTSSPITYLGYIRVLFLPPPRPISDIKKLVHFLPKNRKVSQIYIKFF
jgi:hypothetical protein